MTENSSAEQFVQLLSPASTDDFWNAKQLLESAKIPYQVKGELRPAYYFGARYEVGNTSNIYVSEIDFEAATLICKELIENRNKLERQWANQKLTLADKIKRIFRLF